MVISRILRPEDIPAAQELMADTWSHLLKVQTGISIPYPVRPVSWYLSRMAHEPGGCICLEEDGRIIATGFCLSCGSIGWIGPMEVSPVYQGRGFGTLLLEALELHLASKKCKAVGLETMKDVAKNITFYARGGYTEVVDVIYLEKDWLEGHNGERQETGGVKIEELRRLAATISPGFDPSKEFLISEETGAGTTLYAEGAAALLLKDPIPGSGKSYLRMLLSEGYHRLSESLELVQRAERVALHAGSRSIFTIIPADSELLSPMLRGGYRLKGVDVRLMKGSFPCKHDCSIISWSG